MSLSRQFRPISPTEKAAIETAKKHIDKLPKPDLSGLKTSLAEMTRGSAEKGKRPLRNRHTTLTSIRLDNDVLEAVKATGDGWQTRINDILRSAFAKSRP